MYIIEIEQNVECMSFSYFSPTILEPAWFPYMFKLVRSLFSCLHFTWLFLTTNSGYKNKD